jgi:hypothetical protein
MRLPIYVHPKTGDKVPVNPDWSLYLGDGIFETVRWDMRVSRRTPATAARPSLSLRAPLLARLARLPFGRLGFERSPHGILEGQRDA